MPATDVDSPANGVAGYRLTVLDSMRPSDFFDVRVTDVNRSTSELRLVLLRPLDHETADRHHLRVLAYDAGSPSLTGTLYIDVTVEDANDNAPEFDKELYSTVLSSTPPRRALLHRAAGDGAARHRCAPRQRRRPRLGRQRARELPLHGADAGRLRAPVQRRLVDGRRSTVDRSAAARAGRVRAGRGGRGWRSAGGGERRQCVDRGGRRQRTRTCHHRQRRRRQVRTIYIK